MKSIMHKGLYTVVYTYTYMYVEIHDNDPPLSFFFMSSGPFVDVALLLLLC